MVPIKSLKGEKKKAFHCFEPSLVYNAVINQFAFSLPACTAIAISQEHVIKPGCMQ